MSKRFYAILVALFVCMGLVSVSHAASGSDPVGLLQSIADEMISSLKSHKATLKTNPGEVYSIANRLVVPHADLDYMSQRVLPPQVWNGATSAQRSEFKRQFTTVLERTYASALADYNDQTINFYPVRGGVDGKTTVTVNSQINRSDAPSISVSYSLVRAGSQWKLYDMTVEGVSMLESFRSQFGDILNTGNMAELNRRLAEHNAGRGQ